MAHQHPLVIIRPVQTSHFPRKKIVLKRHTDSLSIQFLLFAKNRSSATVICSQVTALSLESITDKTVY